MISSCDYTHVSYYLVIISIVSASDIRMPLQNVTFSALGVFFVWAGYYAFNMGTIENFTGKLHTFIS